MREPDTFESETHEVEVRKANELRPSLWKSSINKKNNSDSHSETLMAECMHAFFICLRRWGRNPKVVNLGKSIAANLRKPQKRPVLSL